jgi:NAD(P)H dehydrogenase (quinone)
MIIVGLPYSFAGLTHMDQVTGGTPYGATKLAGADGSRQPTENELEGLASRVDMLPRLQRD